MVGGVAGFTKAVPKIDVIVRLGKGKAKGVGGAAPGRVQARIGSNRKIKDKTLMCLAISPLDAASRALKNGVSSRTVVGNLSPQAASLPGSRRWGE